MRRLLGFLILAVAVTAFAAPPSVSKVEPPNWWPNHTLNPVRLLLYGSGLTGASVSAPAPLTATNTSVNAAGTSVFLDLSIPPGTAPGSYPLQLRTAAGSTQVPFRLETPLPSSGRFQGFSPDDVIYLVMPDRFADGDPSNDNPSISPGLFDRRDPHLYHGGDLQGILDHLPYLKSLGITALWLTPVYDNTNAPNTAQAVNGRPIADYHGYGAVDYYAVEEHFGNAALLRKLVDSAHSLGIKVIQDQVANHVGPNHPWVHNPPKPTWFHGTAARHIDETWQIWTLPDPHASPAAQRSVLDGWFMNVLPDMNQEDPDLARYEIQNALWWVGEFGFDAIRQDTLPYVPRAFWHDWSAALKRQFPQLRAVGEVFDPDPAVPSFFQGGRAQYDSLDSGVGSVFDFPVYFNIRDVFAKGASLETLSKTLAEDRLYADPNLLVTFLGNHDVQRFLNEPGATIEKLKLAFTFLMTLRGIPTIYYGDEIGMTGGNDPDNRHDFPGGWRGDAHDAFNETGRTPDENAIFHHVQRLIALRRQFDPLRRGKFVDLAVSANTWAYARQTESGVALVAINNSANSATVSIPYNRDGTYRPQLQSGAALIIADGRGVVSLPPHSAEIYVLAPR